MILRVYGLRFLPFMIGLMWAVAGASKVADPSAFRAAIDAHGVLSGTFIGVAKWLAVAECVLAASWLSLVGTPSLLAAQRVTVGCSLLLLTAGAAATLATPWRK